MTKFIFKLWQKHHACLPMLIKTVTLRFKPVEFSLGTRILPVKLSSLQTVVT